MRKLLEADSLIQVNLIASYLQGNGVTTKVINEHQGSIRSIISFQKSIHPELWVPAEQFEIAAKLVGRYQYEQESNDSRSEMEWLCKKCKESNPANFMSCWNCGVRNDSAMHWVFCSSRSRGQAFKRTQRSSLISALLFRCRSRLFRQSRFTTTLEPSPHCSIPPSGGLCVVPVAAEPPLMAPHRPTGAPLAVKRRRLASTSASHNGDRPCRP